MYARIGARFVRESAAGPIGTGMLLAMLGFALVWLVGLPFQIAALWWERRYGVSHGSWTSYVGEIFGGWLQLGGTFAFLSVAVLVVMGLARLAGQRWWIPGAAFFVGLGGALHVRLCRTSSPTRIRCATRSSPPRRALLAAREGVPGTPVEVESVSQDTDAANAFTTGFGPTRKVVPLGHAPRRPLHERRGRGSCSPTSSATRLATTC